MDTITIANVHLVSFLLILFRVGAVISTAPFFGSKNIPVRVKALLVLILAIILTTSLSQDGKLNNVTFIYSRGLIGLSFVILKEILLGVAIGYTARLTFIGIQLAGQFIGHEMGFAMMRVMDPTTRASVTIISQYNTAVAMLVFLFIRGHHYILTGLAGSFSAVPLGQWAVSGSYVEHLNVIFGSIFSTALRLAIPVMAALFLTKVALAIVARTMPQMNVFVVGFPLQIALGLISMAITLPLFMNALQSLFVTMRDNIIGVYQ